MKVTKELKYNLLVIVVLTIFDLFWDDLIGGGFKNFEFFWTGALFTFTYNIAFFSVYTINYFVLTPRFLIKRKFISYIVLFFGLILVFALTRFLLEEVVSLKLFDVHNYNLDRNDIVIIYLVDSLIYTFKACFYGSVVYLIFRYNENKSRMHQLELQHQEAQVSALRSQIGPHFLFNTLNGFYSDLYDDKPETANDILKLSQLLRYVTYEVKQNFMPLNKEINFIKDYLYFYEKRYEDDFYVKLSIDGHIGEQSIPSLIIIHFIENLCKHGIINDASKPATIRINVSNDYLEIMTENVINSSDKFMDKGIGTANVKKRLDVLFKDTYQLDYNKDGQQFNTYLKMPI